MKAINSFGFELRGAQVYFLRIGDRFAWWGYTFGAPSRTDGEQYGTRVKVDEKDLADNKVLRETYRVLCDNAFDTLLARDMERGVRSRLMSEAREVLNKKLDEILL